MTFRGTWISNPTPWPRLDETWVWSYNQNLIGKDKLPNRSTERPNPVIPAPIDQTWVQRHVQFTGKDTLPFNQDDWPNSQPVQWDRDWFQSFALTHQVVQRPLNQYDWPNPGAPSKIDQVWLISSTYLLGQGQPSSQTDWPNPKPVTWYQDWNNTLVLNMPVFAPSSVTGWDIPPSYTWYQNWSQNLLQTTLAAPPAPLPKNQYDWPNPGQYSRLDQFWKLNLSPGSLIPPFGQNDWPSPTPPSKLDQFWAWNQTRYQGQDRLPNRQQDWPTPYPVQWYQDYKVNLLQTTLFTTPALPNIRQYDWPLPRAYEPLVPSWTYTSQFIVPAPIPPVTIGGQYTECDADEITAAYCKAMEFALKLRKGTPLSINEAAAALAKRGGDARAKSLSSSQRTKIAANAASIRWKK